MEKEQVQNVMSDLNNLPIEILNHGTKLYILRKAREEVLEVIKSLEMSTGIVVSEEINPETNKKAFPNELLRKAEVDKRLKEDEGYQAKVAHEKSLKEQIDDLTLKLEFAKNKFSGAKGMARLGGE